MNEKMLTLLVSIENKTATTEHLTLSYVADKDVRILNNTTTVLLAPKEKIFLPVKAYIERGQPAGTSLIKFTLKNDAAKTIAETNTQLVIEPKRQLRIVANTPQILMDRVGDSLQISTQVYNGGNAAETVHLFATFPQIYGGDMMLKKSITLQPFTNTEVVFSKIIDKDLAKLGVFTVNIAATDNENEYFGNTMVLVQNALGNRRYTDPLQTQTFGQNSRNHITWQLYNPFSEFSSSQNLDLQSEVNIGNTNLSLSMNGTYREGSENPVQLQNTWLKVQRRYTGFQVGNISTNDLEVSTNGRGAVFSYQPGTEKKTSITAGIVEKSYSLLDPFEWNRFPRGSTAFTRATVRLSDYKLLNHQVIFDTDPFQRSFIIKNGYAYTNKKNTAYNFDVGYGYITSTSNSDLSKPSGALGFNYNKNWKRFTLSSNNYYSTGYYPGLKKGALLLEERLSRSFKNFSLYGSYSLNVYNPQDINPLYQYGSYSRRNKGELGTRFNISKGFYATVNAQVVKEHAELFTGYDLSRVPVDFQSTLLSTSVDYTTPDSKNRLSFTHVHGFSHYDDLTDPSYVWQIQAGWYQGNFMLSTNYQRGNLMFYEGNSNGTVSNDTEKIFATLNYRLSLLEKKLNFNFSAVANSDSRYGKNISLGTNADFQLFRTTKIFANFNYNKYSRNAFNTSSIYSQIGITQNLPTWGDETTSYKSGLIKAFAFYDLNNNGSYDDDTDRPATGIKIKINNTIFISDDSGNIKYRKVPYGNYVVTPLENQWYSEAQNIGLDKKEMFITLPLAKTSIIKGGIQYEQAKVVQYDVPRILAGITVMLTNQNNKTFTFYTDDKGEYTAYVPVGTYRISVKDTVLPNKIYLDDNLRTIVTNADTPQTVRSFTLKIKEKKVEVKKFGTAN